MTRSIPLRPDARPPGSCTRRSSRFQALVTSRCWPSPCSSPEPSTAWPRDRYRDAVVIVKALFWASLSGLAWTHVGYPVAAAGLRQLKRREVAKGDITPSVTLIVPAHDE